MSIDDKTLDDLLKEDITIVKEEEKMALTLISEKDRSISVSVVGVGQAGGRLAETFYKYGYQVGVLNTARQDLVHIKVPERKKLFIESGLGGSGKDLELGKNAILEHREDIAKFLEAEVIGDSELLLLVVSGGGGTGSGSVEPMVELLSTFGRPLACVYILPMDSEDAASKKNSLTTLAKLARLSSTDILSTLIIVDNAKIELIYGHLPQTKFWEVANEAIVKPLHMFNTLTSQPSQFTALDPMDFGKILTTGDISLVGSISVKDYTDETGLAQAVLESLEAGLLASGFDLKSTKCGGTLVVGSKAVLDQIPSVNLNYMYSMLSEKTEQANMYKGIYAIETNDDSLTIYTFLSGLGLPVDRVNALKAESAAQSVMADEKQKTRASGMVLDMGEKTATAAQQIHEKIKAKTSGFNKLTNAGRAGIIDKRKK